MRGEWDHDESMWMTGRTSRWGGVAHAIQRRPIPAGSHVKAACGVMAEVGEVPDQRQGLAPSECPACKRAVSITETLIARSSARTPDPS